ncbi:hypothetical protein OSB04_029918 [Centaurea solstitialis]|uniref:Protein kinase domain-containing protein n=1 Tax=Centaurea solstitialis TaxID=347529 RepID=A0AA38W3B7_9ASTR|nr:hypothetical protein OSB04_029918 [Centaurea solstitialis]
MACNSKPPYWLITLLLIQVLLTSSLVLSDDEEDAKTLMKFKDSLLNAQQLSDWNLVSLPCNNKTQNWTGVMCNNDGTVFGLQLENMGLSGTIDVDTLAEVASIRTLSFMNNSFEGPMPDLRKIGPLRGIFLSYNKFSGDISGDAFSGLSGLRKVELANNGFTGEIPTSLTELQLLVDLQLQNNEFEGEIPDFEQKDLKANFANNRLDGSIPKGLKNQDPSSFAGNDLCGKPLRSCKKRNTLKIIIIAIASLVAVLAAIVIATFLCRTKKNGKNDYKSQTKKSHRIDAYNKTADNPNEIQMHTQKEIYKRTDNGGKLHFVRTDRERFELEDLLRASADVLGSGSFGSSYKAMLTNGPAMVVKRYKEMSNVRKEEFHEHMRLLGSLSHPNLLPLVAYYYKKDEKLLITDFAVNGSLANHLHVKRKPDEPGLDWATD